MKHFILTMLLCVQMCHGADFLEYAWNALGGDNAPCEQTLFCIRNVVAYYVIGNAVLLPFVYWSNNKEDKQSNQKSKSFEQLRKMDLNERFERYLDMNFEERLQYWKDVRDPNFKVFLHEGM